ncbi:hypothetical protein ACIGW8_19815 [Streptomyces sioyaensis]|uniref:hypothetical protein n=1 Tax=Streptomyces sioyaensis TaxID=67364 RepID=UPI0037CFB2B2
MNLDSPEHGEPPLRSALKWPPCGCGHPMCPNAKSPDVEVEPEHERADEIDSEPLTRLRARVHQDYERRQRYGLLGRLL